MQPTPTKHWQLHKVILTLLILLTAYLCFYKLGFAPFENWDEAWYADVTRNMMQTGNYIIPMWNQAPFIDKPPLYMWLSSVPAHIFGLTEWSFRLISAISGFATINMVLLYTHRRWGLVSSILAYSSLALNNVYMWRVRSGNLDTLFVLLLLLAFFIVQLSDDKPRDQKQQRPWYRFVMHRYLLLGILFGLMYLTKASLVFLPMLVFGIYDLIFRQPSQNNKQHNKASLPRALTTYAKRFALVSIPFILISGSWLIFANIQHGGEFLNYYLFNSDQGIVSSLGLSNAKIDYWWHAYYMLQRRFFFVFIIGIIALLAALSPHIFRRAFKLIMNKGTTFLILAFSLMLLIFLSFIERNNNWYLVPSTPFWAITIGYGTFIILKMARAVLQQFLPKKASQFYTLFVVGVLLLSGYISYKTLTVNIHALINSQTTLHQKESGLYINENAPEDALIIRLDQQYPATVYYADRKVRVMRDTPSAGLFIQDIHVYEGVQTGDINWFVGPLDAIERVAIEAEDTSWEIVEFGGGEAVLRRSL